MPKPHAHIAIKIFAASWSVQDHENSTKWRRRSHPAVHYILCESEDDILVIRDNDERSSGRFSKAEAKRFAKRMCRMFGLSPEFGPPYRGIIGETDHKTVSRKLNKFYMNKSGTQAALYQRENVGESCLDGAECGTRGQAEDKQWFH